MIDSRNGVIGLAIGDARGVPLEFRIRKNTKKHNNRDELSIMGF